jgi:hypothetical protein
MTATSVERALLKIVLRLLHENKIVNITVLLVNFKAIHPRCTVISQRKHGMVHQHNILLDVERQLHVSATKDGHR